jgi:hypothetical protein
MAMSFGLIVPKMAIDLFSDGCARAHLRSAKAHLP